MLLPTASRSIQTTCRRPPLPVRVASCALPTPGHWPSGSVRTRHGTPTPACPSPHSRPSLRRQLNAITREQFPWMLEVTKCAPQMTIIQLGQALQSVFAGRARYPQFRKNGVHDRFTRTNDQFDIDGSRIRIPNLGWVRMRESLRFAGKLMSATVSRVANRWFVSITMDTPDTSHLPQAENQGAVGVDLGVSALATLSTGETFPSPKPHTALLNRLHRLLRRRSRKQNGSANRKKARARRATLHTRICTSSPQTSRASVTPFASRI
jgi:putative transposase